MNVHLSTSIFGMYCNSGLFTVHLSTLSDFNTLYVGATYVDTVRNEKILRGMQTDVQSVG